MKTYLTRTWISPKLVPGKSAIHGDGIFAAADIAAGEKIMEFGGSTISREEALSDNYRFRSMWMIEYDIFLALPNSDTEPSLDENLNHSCDANIWLESDVDLTARRAIKAGEEITLDQGTWNGTAWGFDEDEYAADSEDGCSCGVPQCRRVLTEEDWKNPALQAQYRGHFHPQVQVLIDRLARSDVPAPADAADPR
jgi:hypothetical protein